MISVGSHGLDVWTLCSTLIGAVTGAAVSGAVSYALARQSNAEQGRQRAEERTAKRRAIGVAVVIKLKLLTDGAYSIHKQLRQSISEASAAGVAGPLWTKLQALETGSLTKIEFSTDELALMIEMEENDLLNELILISQRQRSIDNGLAGYARRRTELFAAIGPPAEMNGLVGTHLHTREEHMKLAPLQAELEFAAHQLLQFSDEQLEKSIDAVNKLGPSMKEHFKDPKFPGLALREDIATPAQDAART